MVLLAFLVKSTSSLFFFDIQSRKPVTRKQALHFAKFRL